MSATLGRIYRLPEPAYIVSHLAALVPTGGYDPRYLTYWLRSNPPFHLIKDPAYPSIRTSEIEQVQVPNISLSEQARIAAILDKADGIRRKQAEALALASDLQHSIFVTMFGSPEANPNRYALREFGSLLAVPLRNGVSPSSRGQVSAEVLTLSAITRGVFDPNERKEGKFAQGISEKDEVSTEDFYICRGSGTPDLVGRGAFATETMPGVVFPDTMIAARPKKDQITRGFLETIWASKFVRRQIINHARTTNGTYKINQTATESIVFPVPPIEHQHLFERRLAKIKAIQQRISAESFGAVLFCSLAQRAFRGEL
jgi:type I restriction enzyme S subunit